MPIISITARGLSRARQIADELVSIEAALDLPTDERQSITAVIGQDALQKIPVPWAVVQETLEERRARLQHELTKMGINLMPPDPAEQDPNGIPFPYQPKPQR